jgi:hypothetical protein
MLVAGTALLLGLGANDPVEQSRKCGQTGEMPTVPAGIRIQAMATGLMHPPHRLPVAVRHTLQP